MNIRPGEGYIVTKDGIESLPGCAYPLPGDTIVTRDEVEDLRAEVAALTAMNGLLMSEMAELPGGAEVMARIIAAVTEA